MCLAASRSMCLLIVRPHVLYVLGIVIVCVSVSASSMFCLLVLFGRRVSSNMRKMHKLRFILRMRKVSSEHLLPVETF